MNHFFALTLPPDVQLFVGDVMERWRRLLPSDVSARWYAPGDCHITLKFLGNVPEARHEELVRAVLPITSVTAPLPVELAPCGGFPSLRRPFVLWVGVAPNAPLTQLAAQLDYALTDLGFHPEGRPYVPHITLARCRAGRRETSLATPDIPEHPFLTFQAHHIALMQTSPPDARPKDTKRRYNTVHLFPFGDTHSSAIR